jgi:uncharacterized protein YjdB
MKRVFLFLILGLACTIGMTSCSEEDKEPGNVPLTAITVDKEFVKNNVRYNPAVENVRFYPVPANATDVDFKMTSADPSVATVELTAVGEGRITILKADSTVVTVSSGQVTKEIKVKGHFDVDTLTEIRLELDKEISVETDSTLTLILPVGDVIDVKASANPRNANTLDTDYVTFNWKSSNTSVATVAEDAGMAKAIDKTGKITVTGKGKAEITISSILDKKDEDGKNIVIQAKTIIIEGIEAVED